MDHHDENELRRTVGKRLRLARKVAELIQDQVATAAGVSRSMVALIEQGAHGVEVYRLRRMATAAGTTLTALCSGQAGLAGERGAGPGRERGGECDRCGEKAAEVAVVGGGGPAVGDRGGLQQGEHAPG